MSPSERASVRVTGLDALRATGNDTGGTGTGVLIGTLLAALGALLVLAFVFRSFTAVIPLLMAVVAIPTTFLLIWPLADRYERLRDRAVPGRADRTRDRDRLRAADRRSVARGTAAARHRRTSKQSRTRCSTQGPPSSSAAPPSGISLHGLLAVPIPALRSIGIAGLLIALVSVAVGVTLLPVVLATVGPKVDWPRNQRDARPSRAWSSWARLVVRHRWLAAAVSLSILGALVVAASTIQFGNPRANSLAQQGQARIALDNLNDSGIGSGPLSPFDALVKTGDAASISKTFATVKGVRAAVAPPDWRRDGTALVTVIPTEDGNSPAGRATLDRLRAVAVDGDVAIGGEAAQGADFLDAVYSNFPLLILLISAATFLLLARAFRSLILPLKAVLLNLLSVAAAWGLLVLVFQHGFGSGIWGIEATRAINVEMPIVVFAFLFGISMDYQVFIISRMREAYDRTGRRRPPSSKESGERDDSSLARR